MADAERRTIRRLVVGHIVAFGLLIVIAGGGAYLAARHMLVRQLDAHMVGRMADAEVEWRSGGVNRLDAWIDHISRQGAHFAYVLIGPDGRTLRSVVGLDREPPDGWGYSRFADEDEGGLDPARTLSKRLPDGSRLTIVADRDFIEQFDLVVLGFMAFAVPLLVAIAMAGSLSLEASVRRRLFDVNTTAAAIIEGELDQRVPVKSNRDEFDALAVTFNRMLDRIGALLGDVRRVTAYVAHDLRTPLVAMADDLRSSSENCDLSQHCAMTLANAADSADRLIELFGMILEIGEISSVRVRESGRLIDLSDLVENIAEAHISVAEDGGRTLGGSIHPNVTVFGVSDLLAQALINLIQNALVHTQRGTHIQVAVEIPDGFVRLTVTDDGPGLSEADRDDILADDRPSQSGGTKRAAIGLKLVNAIAGAHHGTFTLEDAGPGLRAIIQLPIVASPRNFKG